MNLLKLLAITAAITIAWIIWQKRYRFIRPSPKGSTRTKLSRNYTVQRDFLQKVNQAERMKLVAVVYAACGFDSHYTFIYTTAQQLSKPETVEIRTNFETVFDTHRFSFDIDRARDNTAYYQRMCSKLSGDVQFLRVYLEHKSFFEELIRKLTCSDPYFASRNPDVAPDEGLLQLLWTENLERP